VQSAEQEAAIEVDEGLLAAQTPVLAAAPSSPS
jgi:hypothetical protein